MENYNLLYLRNLQKNSPINAEQTDELYEEIVEDLSYLESDCDSDSATLNGVEVDVLGVLSDDAVNSMMKSSSSAKKPNIVTSLVSRLINTTYQTVRNVKQAIADFFNGKKSSAVVPDPIPDPDPQPIDDDDDNDDDVIRLARKNVGGQNEKTKEINGDGVELTLTNTMFGEDYKYTIKTTDGSTQNVKFIYLDNGRLLITGNNLQIDALSGQKDDIVINGHNNIINTQDGDDLIRLGMTVDMSGIRDDRNGSGTGGQVFLNNFYNSVIKNTYNNKVNAGSGNDYIYDYTNGWNGSTFVANTLYGDGNIDSYRNEHVVYLSNNGIVQLGYEKDGVFIPDPILYSSSETNTFSGVVADSPNGNVSNNSDIEDIYSLISKQKYENQISTLESFGQGALGDCRFVALMASLKNKINTSGLSSLGITITYITGASGYKYRVEFNNCTYSNKSIVVDIDDLHLVDDYKGNVYAGGDLTMRLIEYALNELIGQNSHQTVDGETYNWDLATSSWNDYSRYLFGNDKVSMFYNNSMKVSEYFGSNDLKEIFDMTNEEIAESWTHEDGSIYTVDEYCQCYGVNNLYDYEKYFNSDFSNSMQNNLLDLWSKYKNGAISNIVAGAAKMNEKLQICNDHEYAISDVTDNYVELINPWDSQDRLRLDMADFFEHFSEITVFGSNSIGNLCSGEEYNGVIPDEDGPAHSNYNIGDFDNESDNNDTDIPPLLKIDKKPVYGYKTIFDDFALDFEDEDNIFIKKTEI